MKLFIILLRGTGSGLTRIAAAATIILSSFSFQVVAPVYSKLAFCEGIDFMTRQIHLIFKTHLDVGFTDFAGAVIQNYFRKYIPAAMQVARCMRETGSQDRFVWTTGSWLIYEYLEQASARERKEMENAILSGDISWHALPFTTHTELMDAELFGFGLSLSKSLDARFGIRTTAAKMTDVPGHTRAILPLLAGAGVSFLHIGVNPASPVPRVPGLFRWQDPGGYEVTVMYESGYGSAFNIPGSNHSLAFGHTMDNMGPQDVSQVKDVYKEICARLPGEHVFASTLTAFAEVLESVRGNLPVVTNEIGDTWIHGAGSDPIKVSCYRELLRLRRQWLKEGKTSNSNPLFIKFNQKLLLVPEHTWGMDEKSHLGDHENYSAERFTSARGQPNFRKFESSWVEKRAYPQQAVNMLEDGPLAAQARVHLDAIRPQTPDLSRWKQTDKQTCLETPHLLAELSPDTGLISKLISKATGVTWVSEQLPFCAFLYQTFSAEDYASFFCNYLLPAQQHGWAEEDFTKPGMSVEDSESKTWQPLVAGVYIPDDRSCNRVLVHLTFAKEVLRKYGAPADVFIDYTVSSGPAELHIDLQWFHKRATRLPEAIWFSFQPALHGGAKWLIEKMGSEISPLDVIENGNRHLHACGDYVAYRSPVSTLIISPLDSPLVAPGQRSLLNFNNEQPDMNGGVHFCLLNNLWGTNFPMWFEEDCRFRFVLKFD